MLRPKLPREETWSYCEPSFTVVGLPAPRTVLRVPAVPLCIAMYEYFSVGKLDGSEIGDKSQIVAELR